MGDYGNRMQERKQLNNYIITFPQRDAERKDGWVLIKNATADQVKKWAEHKYKGVYAYVYEELYFNEGYYPKGCIEEFDFSTWQDFVV